MSRLPLILGFAVLALAAASAGAGDSKKKPLDPKPGGVNGRYDG